MPTWDNEKSLPGIRSLIKEMHRYAPIGSLGNVHYQPFHARTLTPNHLYNPLQRDSPGYLSNLHPSKESPTVPPPHQPTIRITSPPKQFSSPTSRPFLKTQTVTPTRKSSTRADSATTTPPRPPPLSRGTISTMDLGEGFAQGCMLPRRAYLLWFQGSCGGLTLDLRRIVGLWIWMQRLVSGAPFLVGTFDGL